MARLLLVSTFVALLSSSALAEEAHGSPLRFGPARKFSWARFVKRAQAEARRPYRPAPRPAPELVEQIGYDERRAMRYRPEASLYWDEARGFPVSFFPINKFAPKTVRMHALENGLAREILYAPEYFELPAGAIAERLPPESGFAGFQLRDPRTPDGKGVGDWAAFQGASYFRALGGLRQYGLSARGLAVNVHGPAPAREEFPDFTEFYISPASSEGGEVTVYAKLDGPSVTGAFRFRIQRTSETLMEVEAALFLRRDVARLGLAPLTSMYWYSPSDKAANADWRPAVHDSEGLAITSGRGEHLWRPLNNPSAVRVSAFAESDPRGFGLLQRHRTREHYLDNYAFYDRRPSLWVEPLGRWGAGSVQLVEIPTHDETNDNIVAMWVPGAPARAGMSYRYRYRLHWTDAAPFADSTIGAVLATHRGKGGDPGRAVPERTQKFVVDFDRPRHLGPGEALAAEVQLSAGRLKGSHLETGPEFPNWRLYLDVAYGDEPVVDIRASLRNERGLPATETWVGQLYPADLK